MTPASERMDRERLHRLAKRSQPIFQAHRHKESPPASWDWLSKDGHNWLTPVRDQGDCGSCWAFANIGVMEAALKIATNQPTWNPDLSEQMLVSCMGAGDCRGGRADDWFSRFHGVPPETCFPYVEDNDLCANRCPDWDTDVYKFDTWEHLEDPTVEEIK